MSFMEETFRREVALGFAQLEKGQTVTVKSKEAFLALLRRPVEHPVQIPGVATSSAFMPEACQPVAGASREHHAAQAARHDAYRKA